MRYPLVILKVVSLFNKLMDLGMFKKLFSWKISSFQVTLLVSVFITIVHNYLFLYKIYIAYDSPFLQSSYIIVIITAVLFLLHFIIFNILLVKYIGKLIIIIFFIANAMAFYHIYNYNILFDKALIAAILATDIKESKEIISLQMFLFVAFLGVLPSLILFKTKIIFKHFYKELLYRLILIIISFVLACVLLIMNYKDLSSFFRNHSYFKYLPIPYSYTINTYKVLRDSYISNNKTPFLQIGEDAKLGNKISNNKNTIVVLIVGETAREMNFSLNGYERKTNAPLENKNLVIFENTTSCGTITNVSVPCMFSNLTRSEFSDVLANNRDNLIDILSRAGIDIFWVDNNTGGCINVCKKLPKEKVVYTCNDKNCDDQKLIDELQKYLSNPVEKPTLIVLHMLGSHGPTYHLRFPKEFAKFNPYCKTNILKNCSSEEIINVYDNSIYYTSYLINQTIEIVAKQKNLNSAVVYISDHGESLGENGVYLHGLPYLIAPKEQTHVPFIGWFSESFQRNFFKNSCLISINKKDYSQDNIFHTTIGLLDVETKDHNSSMDIFNPCYKNK